MHEVRVLERLDRGPGCSHITWMAICSFHISAAKSLAACCRNCFCQLTDRHLLHVRRFVVVEEVEGPCWSSWTSKMSESGMPHQPLTSVSHEVDEAIASALQQLKVRCIFVITAYISVV